MKTISEAEFKGRVLTSLENINGEIAEIKECSKNYGQRITVLEFWKVEMMAKITTVTALISVSFTLIWDWLKKRINI